MTRDRLHNLSKNLNDVNIVESLGCVGLCPTLSLRFFFFLSISVFCPWLAKKKYGCRIYHQNSTCTEFHYNFSLFWDANLVLFFFFLKELGATLFIFQISVYFCYHPVNTSPTQPCSYFCLYYSNFENFRKIGKMKTL